MTPPRTPYLGRADRVGQGQGPRWRLPVNMDWRDGPTDVSGASREESCEPPPKAFLYGLKAQNRTLPRRACRGSHHCVLTMKGAEAIYNYVSGRVGKMTSSRSGDGSRKGAVVLEGARWTQRK
jgi:hypothetical protein